MILYYCRSCKITYDGFAQCCPELDHVKVEETTSDSDSE